MIFSDSPQQRALERMMTAVPGFRPRGSGLIVQHGFEYTAEMCDCRYCSYYRGKRKCTDSQCPYIEERIVAGAARTIDPKELPDIDLICGGFPCQSFSIAGRRGGFDDARGTLFFGLTDGRLYKMAGNAISVPVISAIGRFIKENNEKTENER